MTRRLLVPILALCLFSCAQQSAVTTTLQAVLAAAQVVLPLIPGVPPATAAQVRTYLAAVSDGVSKATVILGGTETPAVKAAAISAAFAGIARPNLPPGTAQTIAGAVEAVAQAVASFLSTAGAAASSPRRASTPPPPDITSGDRNVLPKIRRDAHSLKAAVQ